MDDVKFKELVLRKLDSLTVDISGVKTDVGELKGDVSELKSDVSTLKTDVGELKSDVSELKSDVSTLKTDVGELKTSVHRLELLQEETEEKIDQIIEVMSPELEKGNETVVRVELLEEKSDFLDKRLTVVENRL